MAQHPYAIQQRHTDPAPTVTVTWGGEVVRLKDGHTRALVAHMLELEQAASDGSEGGRGTEYVGRDGVLNGPEAHLASVSLCLKALHRWLDMRRVPVLVDAE
jgi:hypothetical protein